MMLLMSVLKRETHPRPNTYSSPPGPWHVLSHLRSSKQLTDAPVLGYADFQLPFILETDASNLGLGAVLYQVQGSKKNVLEYASHRLRGAEKNDQNYSIWKLELLALKWAITEKLRSYLLGSKFTILTDNNPLCHLSPANLGAKLAVFDFFVKYRPGRCNSEADALSRQPTVAESDPDLEDAEFDGSVAICDSLRVGTALGCELAAAGMEHFRVRQLSVVDPDGDSGSIQSNILTLPGYIKAELQTFQLSDPTLKVLRKLWDKKQKPCFQERQILPMPVRSLLKEWPHLRERD